MESLSKQLSEDLREIVPMQAFSVKLKKENTTKNPVWFEKKPLILPKERETKKRESLLKKKEFDLFSFPPKVCPYRKNSTMILSIH